MFLSAFSIVRVFLPSFQTVAIVRRICRFRQLLLRVRRYEICGYLFTSECISRDNIAYYDTRKERECERSSINVIVGHLFLVSIRYYFELRLHHRAMKRLPNHVRKLSSSFVAASSSLRQGIRFSKIWKISEPTEARCESRKMSHDLIVRVYNLIAKRVKAYIYQNSRGRSGLISESRWNASCV